jgi:molecular chaperone HscA
MAKIPIDIKSGTVLSEDKDIVVGIDLGTTNSLIAYIDPETNNPILLGEETIVPSIIHFSEDGSAVVGSGAKAHLEQSSPNTIYSVKRLLGRSYKDVQDEESTLAYKIIDNNDDSLVKIQVNTKYYTPIELSSLILSKLKIQAEKELGQVISKAVITVPAYFNDSQRQATRDAGKLAGLDVLRIVNEPTSASLAYGIGTAKNQKKTIAVYDLGGGTFDISILRIENGIFEVLSTNGDTHLGGDDIDVSIMKNWGNATPALRPVAERAKIHFSNSDEDFSLEWNDSSLSITKEQYIDLLNPLIQKTLDCCQNALSDAELTVEDIDDVVLVGGSTRIPEVKEALKALFNKEVNDSLNPDEVVALGAAIEADILAGNRSDVLLLDVTPLSLGIETMGGLMDVIISRNSKIPNHVAREYTTSVDGQTNLKVSIFQGERELIAENRKLGEFVLRNIPSMPAGIPKIQITFLINADGILKVNAKELRSGTEQEIEVVPQYGLTDEEVERMLLDSLKHATEDVDKRMILELKNEASQIIYHAENFIKKNPDILSDVEIQSTNSQIKALKLVLDSADKDKIQAEIERLNELTQPFAERAMDSAIGKALKGKKIE